MYSTYDEEESSNDDKCEEKKAHESYAVNVSCSNIAGSQYHLHDQEEPGDDDVGEVAGEEGEEERGQDAVLRANAGDYHDFCVR